MIGQGIHLVRVLEVEQEVEKEDRSVQLRENRKDKNRDLVELREEDKEDKVIKDKEENNFYLNFRITTMLGYSTQIVNIC